MAQKKDQFKPQSSQGDQNQEVPLPEQQHQQTKTHKFVKFHGEALLIRYDPNDSPSIIGITMNSQIKNHLATTSQF